MEINTTLLSADFSDFSPLGFTSDTHRRNQATTRRVRDGGATDSDGSGRRVARRQRNADAPKITAPCTECGKKFWSWKALFGHMRCHPEREWRGINPPPNFKRRSFSSSITEEDREAAAWLLMMANGNGIGNSDTVVQQSGSRSIRTARMPLRNCSESHRGNGGGGENGVGTTPSGGGGGGEVRRFRCWSCSKVYSSHHALVAHKNVNICGGATPIKVEPPSTVSGRNLYGGITLDLRLGF